VKEKKTIEKNLDFRIDRTKMMITMKAYAHFI